MVSTIRYTANVSSDHLIIKSIFAFNRKYNIGYHNDCNKNQPKNIKPFHIIYHHKFRFVSPIISHARRIFQLANHSGNADILHCRCGLPP